MKVYIASPITIHRKDTIYNKERIEMSTLRKTLCVIIFGMSWLGTAILAEGNAYIGQLILAEPDLTVFKEKTGSTPPIVFFMVDWVQDEDLFADPKNPAQSVRYTRT